nr:TerC/Alx family metal homeostasis membrane protein [uncultured Propionibacterium sp.]
MLGALVADAVHMARHPHVPSARECMAYIGMYVGLAVAFGLCLHLFVGGIHSGEFFAGWLTEYSLSLDNLFIFLIIMRKMKVPRESQQFALLVGIMLALLFRGAFIALGATLISRLAWVFLLFGAWLIYTAVDLVRDYVRHDPDDDADNATEGRLMRRVKKAVPSNDEFVGDRVFVREDGKFLATSLFFVIVALGSTDVMFALDSIPAIFGLTQQPYIVFTANVFALMGLRQLYFLLGNLLNRLVYLPIGLSVLLTFIGVKLVLHAMHHYGLDARLGFDGEIPTSASLLVIVAILGVTTIVSIARIRHDRRAVARAKAERLARDRARFEANQDQWS